MGTLMLFDFFLETSAFAEQSTSFSNHLRPSHVICCGVNAGFKPVQREKPCSQNPLEASFPRRSPESCHLSLAEISRQAPMRLQEVVSV